MCSRHLPLILLLLLLLLLTSAANSTDPSQCTSLLNLKQSFNPSLHLSTWQPNTDCCKWQGVGCDPISGLVTALDLSNRFISGNISSSLFKLTSLKELNLAYSKFSSIPIPNGFEFLENLTSLNLSNAGFVGQVPSGIGKLVKLEVLDLSSFYLNEVVSLRLDNPSFESLVMNLSNLRKLYLDGVNISKNGYEWCGALAKATPKLTSLSLSSCSINGPIDSSLAKLSDLSVIRLSQNQLNCSVPEFFAKFLSFKEIDLSAGGLIGNFPNSVFLLKNLTAVDLSSNTMLYGSLPEFNGDSKLRKLLLADTKFSGYLPKSIGNMKSLTTMDLSNCTFEKEIPSSIGNLGQLVYLDLSKNKLTDSIPNILPLGLSVLNLANNMLNGSIPSSIGELQNLTKLDLSDNSLSGHVPVSLFALPSLQVLNLQMNKLSGLLPNFSKGTSQLSIVDLSDNKLRGDIPRSVFQLSGLKILSLGLNNFSGIVEMDWLADLKNLTNLDLSYNQISIQEETTNTVSYPNISTLALVSCNLRKVPNFLKNQFQMSSIDLSDNNIGGSIPKWIWSIGNFSLNYLNLSHNKFTYIEGPLPSLNENWSINNLDLHSNLIQGPIPLPPSYTVVLDYSNNNFSSSLPSNISSYIRFTVFFSIANNGIMGEIPPSICNVTFLQILDFSNNLLTGSIPPCLFEESANLVALNLRNNQINGTIPSIISEECGMRTINLNGNKLEGIIPKSLSSCNGLEILDLGNNYITDTFPYWIANISSLQVLVLRSNKLYGPVQSENIFSNLQIIDISSNNFSGSLPPDFFKNLKAMMLSTPNFSSIEFEYLRYSPTYYQNTISVTIKGLVMQLVRVLRIFTSLDFSNNNFEGDIPDIVSQLVALDVLNFSQNALTGDIPTSIGNLTQLESLDLSRNHLSGEIPVTLSDLTFLSFLSLSNNYLTGKIPQGNQLSTFSNTSYEGNIGLCGSPLTKNCIPPFKPEEVTDLELRNEVNWQFVYFGLGFGGGLAIAVGTILMWDKGRNWYNMKVDKMLQNTVFWILLKICNYFGDRRVAAEYRMDDDSKEIHELSGKKFCVFCTELVLCQGKARIHHVECDCPLEE